MLRIIQSLLVFCLVSFGFTSIIFASPAKHFSGKRVIYITVDGVRWQDIFLTQDRLPTFWQKYAKNAVIYGQPNTDKTMEVASIPVSLPSYQSQMAGSVQPCGDNECGRIRTQTLGETLVSKLGLPKKDVASISCWK